MKLWGIIKRGLKIPTRACSEYFYLSQDLGRMGISCVEDEAHITRVTQAFKFLANQSDPTIRQLHYTSWQRPCPRGLKILTPPTLKTWHCSLTHLLAQVKAELVTSTSLSERAYLSWTPPLPQRKLAFLAAREGMGALRLKQMTDHTDQDWAFPSLSLHPVSSYFMYSGAFMSLYQYRFLHKARLDLLPVRTVQAHRQIPSTQCRVCNRAPETIAHVLNLCLPSMDMIRAQHNAILDRLESHS